MQIAGYSGTFDMDGKDIIREVADDVLFDDLDFSPLVTYMSQINGNETITKGRWKFEWQEDVADKPFVTCTSGIAAVGAGVGQNVTLSATDIRVGNRYYQSTTRQTFQVTGVSGSTITIVRVPLTSATTAVSGTPVMVSLGNHYVEGGFYTAPSGQTPDWHFNYINKTMQAVASTRDLVEEETYHGSDLEYNKVAKLQQFRSDQERLVLFGTGFLEMMTQTLESGKSATGYSMGSSGIEESITNVKTYTGTLDEATLDSFCRNFVWGSRNAGNKEKLALCGPNVIQAINGFAKNRLHTMEGATDYGLDISEYIAYAGRRLHIMEEREFTDNPDYADAMWVIDVDPKIMTLVQRGNYFTVVEPTQFPDQELVGIRFKSRFGLKMRATAHKHSILRH